MIEKYIEKLQNEIEKTEKEIASKERRLILLRAKLKTPKISLADEQKSGSLRFKELNGEKVNKRKNSNVNPLPKSEAVAVPPVDPVVAPVKEKKKTFGFFNE